VVTGAEDDGAEAGDEEDEDGTEPTPEPSCALVAAALPAVAPWPLIVTTSAITAPTTTSTAAARTAPDRKLISSRRA
jgi:hypothetical protein